ncbi:hypothetical protein JNK62_01955 [bacterium]|nr:hypothetical protein [bacterium]
MSSFFREILFLAPMAAFILRIAAGSALGLIAYRHVFVPQNSFRMIGIVEGVIAVLLIAGAYTQPAALIGAIVLAIILSIPAYRALPRSTLALLIVMCLSLVLTGAGPFAFDLPL